MYRPALFAFYKKTLFKGNTPTSLGDLLRGRRVCVGARQSGTEKLVKALFRHFQIDTASTHIISAPNPQTNSLSDTVDISCSVSGVNNWSIARMLTEKEGAIFSLDKVELAGKGSTVDGFCLNYRQAYPFVLPRLTFARHPEQPVLTVAVDNVLLTREETDPLLVRQMVEMVLSNRQVLADENPLFSTLREDFDQSVLSFPLHEGTKRYLERNEPSVYEKYGNFFNLVFSILVPVVTALSVLYTWSERRRKTRIEKYVGQVLAIDDQLNDFQTPEECDAAALQIRHIRRQAYQQLIDDKLTAGDNFKIFITQTDDALKALRERRQQLKDPS